MRRTLLVLACLLLTPLHAAAVTTSSLGTSGPVSFGDMAFGPDGTLYVSDCENARIYRVSQAGRVSVFAGAGPGGFDNGYSGDGGPAIDAHFSCPVGLAFDANGSLFVADHLNDAIRRIDTAGIVTTVVGGPAPYPWWWVGTKVPGVGPPAGDGGPATQATLDAPWGIAFDRSGNLYIADRDHDAIRMVNKNGIITTVAGKFVRGFSGDGGLATQAKLNRPLEVAFGPTGGFDIADENNARLRGVDANGVITTIAGTGELGCSGDGGSATSATVQNPNSIAFSSTGALYVTEGECHRVRKIQPDGTIQPAVGSGRDGCSGFDGPASRVQLSDPEELRFGPHGDLFVSDAACGVIIRIDPTGMSHLFATAP